MAEEDFVIDIYGDGSGTEQPPVQDGSSGAYETSNTVTVAHGSNNFHTTTNTNTASSSHAEAEEHVEESEDQGQNSMDVTQDNDYKPQQGTKRKEGSDERPIDPGATHSLLVSDLNWWTTDDDIRGWVAQANCEDELKDTAFSEHKVNGKSKGQAFLDFTSQQAATATKNKILALADMQSGKKQTVIYTSANNPFRTLPKDVATRGSKEMGSGNSSRGGASSGGYQDRNYQDRNYQDRNSNEGRGGYGGNYRGRGAVGNHMGRGGGGGPGGFNRNFSGGGSGGGYNNNNNNNNNNMGGYPGNFGFGPRGNMMGGGMRGGGMMRGGRGGGGGMNNGMNPMTPMMGNMGGGMPNMAPMQMGGMPGNMTMGMMASPMAGFQGPFNPAFFAGNQGGGGDWQNPHGAKRARGE